MKNMAMLRITDLATDIDVLVHHSGKTATVRIVMTDEETLDTGRKGVLVRTPELGVTTLTLLLSLRIILEAMNRDHQHVRLRETLALILSEMGLPDDA